MTRRRLALVGAAALAAAGAPTIAEARDPLVQPEGCSLLSRFNSCRTWSPGPVATPTDGPLTDTLPDDPLDLPKDPLGIDAAPPKQRAPLLTPARDRLGGTKNPLGVGQ
jgi:hypothetical protein